MSNNSAEKPLRSKKKSIQKHLEHINLLAAGIDIGSRTHFVAVPEGCSDVTVREFDTFTTGLNELSNWLKECGIETVAMESTGVYWIPLFELLESKGFTVMLVDARKIKNVSGRKTDVLDCQWIQQLHTYGLLNGAFRPNEEICELRAYFRQRGMLIKSGARHIQHMQKALSQMNVQLSHVLSDITGDTGMKIIRAIVSGTRDPKQLASYRNAGCKHSEAVIEKSLTGNYKKEHIFELSQALILYDAYRAAIKSCDEAIEACLLNLAVISESTGLESKAMGNPKKTRSHCKNKLNFDGQSFLVRITGVDLTAIPGIEASSALKIISEIGLDLSRWKTSKHFASWLGLCPGNKVSGGKRLSSKTKRTGNYVSSTLRMAASTLHRSQSALGAFFRRLKARLGAPKATTAAAHKLATIIFNMLKNKTEYNEVGQSYYEEQYQGRVLHHLKKKAQTMGFGLVKIES